MFIDTHCHLDFPQFNQDRSQVIERARAEGIEYVINIGSSVKGSIDSLGLSKEYDFIYASVGIHPHEADNFDEKSENSIRQLAKKEKVVAIGEIGLDYFKNYSKLENQKPLFISMLKLAKELDKPVVIHSRQAQNDTLKIIKESMPLKGVVHCFSGDVDFLKAFLDLGFFVSFTCNITYKNANNLRAIVKETPLEKLLLETDAPYLAPEGLRGARNEPAFIKLLAEEVAKIKEVSMEEVARATTANAKLFFNLK
ncbi:MAG: TatD family hydrolase [Candidatus Omnitrophica bacterium]|nr:TatD family hydrolase [Candidatus Omnitrophota bacterium]MDD5238246.1 TatD family hydrolase [Candidatus Omnitrophota bacterium]